MAKKKTQNKTFTKSYKGICKVCHLKTINLVLLKTLGTITFKDNADESY